MNGNRIVRTAQDQQAIGINQQTIIPNKKLRNQQVIVHNTQAQQIIPQITEERIQQNQITQKYIAIK